MALIEDFILGEGGIFFLLIMEVFIFSVAIKNKKIGFLLTPFSLLIGLWYWQVLPTDSILMWAIPIYLLVNPLLLLLVYSQT